MTEEAKIFRDIANEELAHVGEFQVILEKHGLSPKEQIEQGEEEAHEIINPTTPAEDEVVDLPEAVNEASKIAVHVYKSDSGIIFISCSNPVISTIRCFTVCLQCCAIASLGRLYPNASAISLPTK